MDMACQISANANAGLGHRHLIERQSRSTNTLSRRAPLPSIEMAISALFSTALKSIIFHEQ